MDRKCCPSQFIDSCCCLFLGNRVSYDMEIVIFVLHIKFHDIMREEIAILHAVFAVHHRFSMLPSPGRSYQKRTVPTWQRLPIWAPFGTLANLRHKE